MSLCPARLFIFYYEAYKAIHSTENDDLKEVQKIHLATRQANRFAVFARYPQSTILHKGEYMLLEAVTAFAVSAS